MSPAIPFHLTRHLASLRLARCITSPTTNFSYLQFQRFIPTPPATPTVSGASPLRYVRHLHLLFRVVNDGLLRSELQGARSPYLRHVPPTHRGNNRIHYQPCGTSVHRLGRHIQRPVGQRGLFAPGASAYIHSSIASPPTPLRFNPRSHEWRGQFVGYGESVKATSPPLCKGSLRYAPLATKRLATHSRTSSPGKSPFRRLTLHSVVVASIPG